MPILMTVINIGSALIYTQNLSKRDKYQLYGMAAIFLVLLYNAAAGLVLYWTFNNIYSLAKNAVLHVIGYNGNKTKTLKPLTPSYVWTLPLGIALPFAFLWANNIFTYTFESLLFCSLLVVGASLICWILLKQLASHFNLQKNKWFIVVYAITLGLVLCFFSLSIIKGAFYAYRWQFVWILPLTCLILILCFGFRFTNILITSQLVLSLGIACYNIGSDYKASKIINNTSKYEFIQFEKKPNIYLFFCESYQNLNTVKRVFGYDSSVFLKKLHSLGLRIYDNTYSNSYFTLGSLRDLTTMSYRRATVGNLDAFSSERQIFGGGNGNTLLKLFKQNGYETTFIVNSDSSFFTKKGTYLDNTDYKPDWRLLLFNPMIDANYYFDKVLSYFIHNSYDRTSDLNTLKSFVNEHRYSDKPQLYIHYLITAFHTPSDGSYNYTMKSEWEDNAGYPDRIKSANQTVFELASFLRHSDPDALIIFIGDHGPWRVRDFPFDYNNLPRNKSLLSEINEDYQSIIDDLFHVFSAIYYPKEIQPLEHFSHVNLFPQLFQQLAPKSLTEIKKLEQKNNLSIFENRIMAVDGSPHKDFLFWASESLQQNKN